MHNQAEHLFELGDLVLQSGATLREAKLAYKAHGTLNADKSNVIVYPTPYSAYHCDIEWLIGPDKALDPQRYFIIVADMLGNGLSSSPSNTPPPYDRGRFPQITIYDNVVVQHRLLTQQFGVEHIALVVGWSMGAEQTFQWAVSYPQMVNRIAPFCGTARTTSHNVVFLEDFLIGFWERRFLRRDANNLLAMLRTWQHNDVSGTPPFAGDLAKALGSIRAKALVMAGETDLYFPPEDLDYEASLIPGARFEVIRSVWGHQAGNGLNPEDSAFIDRQLKWLLAQ